MTSTTTTARYTAVNDQRVVLAAAETFQFAEDGIVTVTNTDGTTTQETIFDVSDKFEIDGVVMQHGFLTDPNYSAEREARAERAAERQRRARMAREDRIEKALARRERAADAQFRIGL